MSICTFRRSRDSLLPLGSLAVPALPTLPVSARYSQLCHFVHARLGRGPALSQQQLSSQLAWLLAFAGTALRHAKLG